MPPKRRAPEIEEPETQDRVIRRKKLANANPEDTKDEPSPHSKSESGSDSSRSSDGDAHSENSYWGEDRENEQDPEDDEAGGEEATTSAPAALNPDLARYGEDYYDGIGDTADYDNGGTDEEVEEDIRNTAIIRIRDRRREDGEDSDTTPSPSEVAAEIQEMVDEI